MKMSDATNETIKSMELAGIKFNIVTPVDYRWELHHEIANELTGEKKIDFVAEVDGYGNITEWGKAYAVAKPESNVVLNADGEQV